MRPNIDIYVTVSNEKQIQRLNKSVRALAFACTMLLGMCVKNHLDICEQDLIIEKLRAERNDLDA